MADTPTTVGQEFYPITGIVPTGPTVPNRRNIEVWYAERLTNAETAIQVTLFILAMNEWYLQPVDDQLSYFRVAGIHGQPYGISWDQADNTNGVFCVHGQPTFPTFHRVYLSLYEQVLHEIMGQIVDKTFPIDSEAKKAENEAKNTAWHAAADNWRLPFWDWTTNSLPLIATVPTISVLDPVTGEWSAPISNPMYSFRIDSKYNTMGDPKLGAYAIEPMISKNGKVTTVWPFDKCQGTSRHVIPRNGAESTWVEGTSNNEGVSTAMTDAEEIKSAGYNSLSDCVSRLMTEGYFSSWEQFATTKYYDDQDVGSNWLSLEQIHNAVHDFTGGSSTFTGLGHMCWVPTAAFDPIFWHHHCFIDLLCAWWQSENPSKFFDQPVNSSVNPQTGKVDPDPPVEAWLPPFHSKKVGPDANWTSEKARYINDFHYGYEYGPWPNGSGSVATGGDGNSLASLVNEKLNLTRSTVLDAVEKHPKIQLNTKKDNDVILNVRYNRYELNGGDPYKINFFIGDVDETIPLPQNESYVGAVYNFSASVQQTGCANCKQQLEASTLHTGQVPITTPIIQDAIDTNIPEFNVFQRQEIENYLKEKLSWKITSAGEVLPLSAFPDLHVAVYIGTAHHSERVDIPSRYSGYEPLYAATESKVGGAAPPST